MNNPTNPTLDGANCDMSQHFVFIWEQFSSLSCMSSIEKDLTSSEQKPWNWFEILKYMKSPSAKQRSKWTGCRFECLWSVAIKSCYGDTSKYSEHLYQCPWSVSTSTLLSQPRPLLQSTWPLPPLRILRLTDCIRREMNIPLFCAVGAETSKASMSSIMMHKPLFWSLSDGNSIPLCHASSIIQVNRTYYYYQNFEERCVPNNRLESFLNSIPDPTQIPRLCTKN